MKFVLNWNLEGFRGKLHAAGVVIEADIKEVEQWVAKKYHGLVDHESAAVLTPVDDDTPVTEPVVSLGSEVDLTQLSKPELVDHANEFHDLDLNVTASKASLIAQISEARTAAALAVVEAQPVVTTEEAAAEATADVSGTQATT